MFKNINNSRLKSVIEIATALLILCLLVPALADDDEGNGFSQCPPAVQATILREVKGFVIDDVDRDTDDGKVVYEVDARNPDGRRTEFKVAQDGSLFKFDGQLRPEELPAHISKAIKDAVGDVVFFRIRKRVAPNEKLNYYIEADTEKTEISLRIAADGTIINKQVTPVDRNNVNEQSGLGSARKLLIKLRNQLKIAGFGDSRGRHGINPRYFLGEENLKYPMALNFSESGAGLGRCKAIIEDYMPLAPNLEWVVYGTSPRIFNKYYDNWGAEQVQGGRAYRTDRMGWGVWEQKVPEKVPASKEFGSDHHIGYEVEDKVEKDEYASEDDKADARRSLRKGRYEFDMMRVNAFEAMIAKLEKRNIKLLAFTPPMHPVSAGQPCVDDDGTTVEAYDELIAKMRNFEKKYPNFYFVDVNNKGRHGIPGNDFQDMDHLNQQGSKKLTLILDGLIKKFDSQKKRPKTLPGLNDTK